MGSLTPGWDSVANISHSHDDRLSSPNLARSISEIKKELMEMHQSLPSSPAAAGHRVHALGETHGIGSPSSAPASHPLPVPEADELEIEVDETTRKPKMVAHKKGAAHAESWWQRSNSAFMNEKSMTREDLLGSYTPQYLHKTGLHESVAIKDIHPEPKPSLAA